MAHPSKFPVAYAVAYAAKHPDSRRMNGANTLKETSGYVCSSGINGLVPSKPEYETDLTYSNPDFNHRSP